MCAPPLCPELRPRGTPLSALGEPHDGKRPPLSVGFQLETQETGVLKATSFPQVQGFEHLSSPSESWEVVTGPGCKVGCSHLCPQKSARPPFLLQVGWDPWGKKTLKTLFFSVWFLQPHGPSPLSKPLPDTPFFLREVRVHRHAFPPRLFHACPSRRTSPHLTSGTVVGKVGPASPPLPLAVCVCVCGGEVT